MICNSLIYNYDGTSFMLISVKMSELLISSKISREFPIVQRHVINPLNSALTRTRSPTMCSKTIMRSQSGAGCERDNRRGATNTKPNAVQA